jgi:hypothetical protein
MSFKKDQTVIHNGKSYTFDSSAGRGKVNLLDDKGGQITVATKEVMHETAWKDAQAKAAAKAAKKSGKTAKAEKPAKKAKAEKKPRREKAAVEGVITSGQLTYDPSRYVRHDEAKTPSGSKVRDIDDEVAATLREAGDLDKQFSVVAKTLNVTAKSLKEQYGHLNAGMQRMNLGNKLRGALRAAAAAE